jgi:hypothetical protein
MADGPDAHGDGGGGGGGADGGWPEAKDFEEALRALRWVAADCVACRRILSRARVSAGAALRAVRAVPARVPTPRRARARSKSSSKINGLAKMALKHHKVRAAQSPAAAWERGLATHCSRRWRMLQSASIVSAPIVSAP